MVVQDVALCLRSFCGERVLISYEKFCERFKKSVGYSLKEHLMKCSYNFEQLIDQVSRTTRTKCKYNAVLKVISILPDQVCGEKEKDIKER
ncbi:hypothetical protein Q1695_015141 [Nippostrongylus brasiliensis]|nr:hypothetical protein Q1695_015141 [Nippostrongylus brasiliensis]